MVLGSIVMPARMRPHIPPISATLQAMKDIDTKFGQSSETQANVMLRVRLRRRQLVSMLAALRTCLLCFWMLRSDMKRIHTFTFTFSHSCTFATALHEH